jgi:ABC-type protease/lipase transport system fused ATPase/permease subunit
MLRQLHLLTVPAAVSIAFFDATFFLIARVFVFSGREIVLGIVAGAIGGICVLVAVLWQGSTKAPARLANQAAELPRVAG